MSAAAVFADIARPRPAETPKAKAGVDSMLSIRLRGDATEARLIIPKDQIRQLRAQLEQMDAGSDNTAAASSAPSFSRTQTIVGGLFLSMSMVFGGMWFVRSGKAPTRAGKNMVVLAMAAAFASAATLVYANAGPPSDARSITGRMFSQAVHAYGSGWGRVKLEVGNTDSESIELIVPNPRESPTPKPGTDADGDE